MLKFKLGNGKSIKANFTVFVCGKSLEGREYAVTWLCDRLVVNEGQILSRQRVESESHDSGYLLKTISTGEVCGIILSGLAVTNLSNPYPDVVFKVIYLRDLKRYVIVTDSPDLGIGYLI